MLLRFARTDINAASEELLKGILQGNPTLKVSGSAQSGKVDNYVSRLTPLQGPSSMRKGEKENVILLTVMHTKGLFYAIFIAPESRWPVAEPEYRQMIQTIRFSR